jgi:ComF family protein
MTPIQNPKSKIQNHPSLHRTIATGLLDFLLPRHCAVSGRPLMDDEPGPLSPEVMREVELAGADYCRRCGDPQGAGVGVISGCQSCEARSDGFGTREIVAAGRYQGVLEEMCLALKFGGERRVAIPLAGWIVPLLYERGIAPKIESVVPVPLSALRRLQRGYNQAAEIARQVAKHIGCPLLDGELLRANPTERQALLSVAQRRKNVAGSFKVRHADKVTGRTLLLVDDVMTTGATLAEAARTLKRAGAKAVYGAIAARAPIGRDR